jgi:peptidoglycan/xylan/chitin deacetylase (PgdA/CDA1 family)
MVDASTKLIRRIVDVGHALGNHTYDHPYLPKLANEDVLSQVRRCQEAVERALGRTYPMQLVRPPYGSTNARVRAVLREAGYTLVGWHIDSRDYALRREGPIIDLVYRSARRRSGILLMHDTVPATARALPSLIADLRAGGFAIEGDPVRLLASGLPRLPGEP